MDDEWDTNDPETLVTHCWRCGREKPCQKAVDLFVLEGISDGPKGAKYWCKPCLDGRRDDV